MTDTTTMEMLSVFMLQERAANQDDAEKMLSEAWKRPEGCLGGRIVPPGKSQKGKFRIVQTFYEDSGEQPPSGMARLKLPLGSDLLLQYGINPKKRRKKKAG